MEKFSYLLGSKLLELHNARDTDIVTYMQADTKVAKEAGCKSISFENHIIDHFIKGSHIRPDPYKAYMIYQLSAGFNKDNNYVFQHFNILEHVSIWKEWLKAYMNDSQIEQDACKLDILPKKFYGILYQYYMIKENTHWISEEARAKVQKIHDLEMPSSYFEELRALINSL